MIANMGGADRIIRLLAAVALATVALFSGLPLFAEPLWLWGSLAVATILALTASMGFCPLYLPFGLSTRRRSHQP